MRLAKCEAQARYHKAEVEAKAKKKFARPRPVMPY